MFSFFSKKRKLSHKFAHHFLADSHYHTYVETVGKPVWSQRHYSKFSDEGYIKNVVAHSCIKMITVSAATVPWVLYQLNGQQKSLLKDHPLLDVIHCPHALKGRGEFFEELYGHRLISGNTYIHAIRGGDGQVRELGSLRPDRVQVIAGAGSVPQGYRYTIGKRAKDFKVDAITGESDILHLKYFHPLNDWYGLSAIEAAAYSIDQHNQAAQWNQALLQNGARPSGALVLQGGNNGENRHLSDEQYHRIKEQLDEEHSGAANAGRPMLLEGGLDWKEMSMSPKDMDFINSKNSAARDIALAFGVPPQLLGIPGDNTYSNLAEARLAFWEQTVLPLVDSTVHSFNNWLVPKFNEKLELSYNTDEISALSPRREAMWNRVKDASFLSDEEKKEMVGLGS